MGAVHKVAILGSGPAGLSAAARAAARGMDHVLLEKTDRLSDTIFRYQRGKHIMATPTQLVLRSDIDFEAGRREVILDRWGAQTTAASVNVRYQAEATAITGQKGDFQIALADGETLRAETIVLAIGTQGNPNRLTIPGADLPTVQYSLDDPTEYVDEHIVVVGGGDAGIENALGLIGDSAQGNVVTLLNKSMDFARAKEA
ncbi:NAD(P)-binding domain-containing protein, partial [Nostoc sp. CHAB 5834]|nr:NAD(P)-binding domain-containing protein [Nostoc sp. CHAB 5834]